MKGFYIDDNGKLVTGSGLETESDIMTAIAEKIDDGNDTGFGSKVVLYNDDIHSFQDVVHQLIKAINCTERVGFYHATQVHTKGKSLVYSGEPEKCIKVANILKEIRLRVKIES